MASLQRPKKIVLTGSDGRDYPFLAKPKDDLRKDYRWGCHTGKDAGMTTACSQLVSMVCATVDTHMDRSWQVATMITISRLDTSCLLY
jgi:hypothetical protein